MYGILVDFELLFSAVENLLIMPAKRYFPGSCYLKV